MNRHCIRTFSSVRDFSKIRPSRFRNLADLAFGKYLLISNTVTAGVLMVIGDVGAQMFERHQYGDVSKPMEMNLVRVGQMFLSGAVMGPIQHYFYYFLDSGFPAPTTANVFKKLFFDQTIMSPGSLIVFFYTSSLLEGRSTADFRAEMQEKFVTMYMMNFMFWPFAQYANFRYIPVRYRVVYINGLTILYNIWLSYAKHNSLDTDAAIHPNALESQSK